MSERIADINLKVTLDERAIPKKIEWSANESNEPGLKTADAFLLAIWDKRDRKTLSIDLWTKELTIDSMNNFTFQTLLKLAETYKNATGNQEVFKLIYDCAIEVGNKIIPENQLQN